MVQRSARVSQDAVGLPSLPKKTGVQERSTGQGSASRNRPNVASLLFFSSVFIIGLWGWWHRGNMQLSAESGLGYWLGLIGGSMMLALLLYPARKHIRLLRRWGKVSFWFSSHMILGVVGPLLILFHSDFSLGSTNSNLALFCMLAVASSGFLGRFFYSRVHYGLYGGKASLKELRGELKLSKGHLGDEVTLSISILSQLRHIEKRLFKRRNMLTAFLLLPFLSISVMLTRYKVSRLLLGDLKKQARKNDWDKVIYKVHARKAVADIREYFFLLKKTYGFSLYERLFSLWHLFHMPLFIMLLIAGVIHVVVVHLY